MTVAFPEATRVQGNTKVAVAAALAASPAVSLATDINAASTVDGSLTFYQVNPTSTQNKGTQPARIAEKGQLDQLGNVQFTAPTLVYAYDPQGDDTAAGNKLKAALPESGEVFLIERLGLDAKNVAFAVDDRVRVHHITLGHQNHIASGTDEYAVYQISQETSYVEEPFEATVAA